MKRLDRCGSLLDCGRIGTPGRNDGLQSATKLHFYLVTAAISGNL
jgi:hypothetical protein